jgi:hypothetical protein
VRVLGAAGRGTTKAMQEPGLDRHEWETEWEDLAERLADDPYGALDELDDLIARMMDARGLPLGERESQDESEPETVGEFAEARRITQRVAAGEDVGPGDVGYAVNAHRELYDVLLNRGLAS